jgi:hypothetical protein
VGLLSCTNYNNLFRANLFHGQSICNTKRSELGLKGSCLANVVHRGISHCLSTQIFRSACYCIPDELCDKYSLFVKYPDRNEIYGIHLGTSVPVNLRA